MNFEFKIGGKYTLVSITGMAITIRSEIIIIEFDEEEKRYFFRHKGKKKTFYAPKAEDIAKQLAFLGHDLPFVLDSETDRFRGNATFNFVTDNPAALREFLETKCLNPAPETFAKIHYSPEERDSPGDLPDPVLFEKASSIF